MNGTGVAKVCSEKACDGKLKNEWWGVLLAWILYGLILAGMFAPMHKH